MIHRSPASLTGSRAVVAARPHEPEMLSPFEVSPLPADVEPPTPLDPPSSRPYDTVRALQWPATLRTNAARPALPDAPVGSLGRADWLAKPRSNSPSDDHAAQPRYERLFWEGVCAIARGVQQSLHAHGDDGPPDREVAPINGIFAMWQAAMDARSRIAWQCGDLAFDVGMRDPSDSQALMNTPMIAHYEPQARSVIEHLVRSRPPRTDEFSLVTHSSEATDRAFGIESPAIALHRVDIGMLDRTGRRLPLTSTVLPVDRGVERRSDDPMLDYTKVMSHTAARLIPELMGRAHECATRALDPSIDPGAARRHVASFMWALYHACPSTRGSAAMTDMCATALFLARGDAPHAWPKGVVGDIEALLRSEPLWIEHYLEIGFEPAASHESEGTARLEASLRRRLGERAATRAP
ncbi:MAG: hypothetical protein RJA99_2048 [Pseudomonadota bacterium]|jgi:hypothetical protein